SVDDYLRCVDLLAPVSDYLAINVSSPNTPNLRELQEAERLSELLEAVGQRLDRARPVPTFLKIAPDLADSSLDALGAVALAHRLSGVIATNTTVARPFAHRLASEEGGLSGEPLRETSTRVIGRIYQRARGRLEIIGVGGIFNAAHAYEKIRAGARVVQLYTGFIYEGPAVVARMLPGLRERLQKDGFKSIRDAVGADHR